MLLCIVSGGVQIREKKYKLSSVAHPLIAHHTHFLFQMKEQGPLLKTLHTRYKRADNNCNLFNHGPYGTYESLMRDIKQPRYPYLVLHLSTIQNYITTFKVSQILILMKNTMQSKYKNSNQRFQNHQNDKLLH